MCIAGLSVSFWNTFIKILTDFRFKQNHPSCIKYEGIYTPYILLQGLMTMNNQMKGEAQISEYFPETPLIAVELWQSIITAYESLTQWNGGERLTS